MKGDAWKGTTPGSIITSIIDFAIITKSQSKGFLIVGLNPCKQPIRGHRH
jgi:hypothetical protein